MAKKAASTSDLRLRRIIEIHKSLRDKPHKTSDLLEKIQAIDEEANERIVKADIDFLRQKLHAPIKKGNKHHGFSYDKPFSLLEQIEGQKLSEINELLAYIQQSIQKLPSYFELDKVLLALEKRVRTTEARQNPYIEFEKVELYNLERLDEFYRLINKRKIIEISYHPFAEIPQQRIILPLFLKEYNHRWTLIAYDKEKGAIQNFSLDRIIGKVILSSDSLTVETSFDSTTYFKDVIGNSIETDTIEHIVFRIKKKRAYYVETKKWHSSQQKTTETNEYIDFQLTIKPNREFWAKAFEHIEDIEFLSPESIVQEWKERVEKIYLVIS